jgi:hypothetical protein
MKAYPTEQQFSIAKCFTASPPKLCSQIRIPEERPSVF